MYTIHNFQEAVQQGNGMGGYVWLALIIFFLMVFLGWLASSKGWLKKEETPASVDHGHDAHDIGDHVAESQHSEAVSSMVEVVPEPVKVPEAPIEIQAASPVVGAVSATKNDAPDDLTILEGIGPKVATVLAGIGITTFAELAIADLEKVRAALDYAGYKYMEPAGWIEQAAVAATGDMEGLKKLQAELKGGRRVS